MTDARLPCRTPQCTRTILPATAARTGGYCMPCSTAQAAERAAAAAAARPRHVVDLYTGRSRVQQILLLHRPPAAPPDTDYVRPPHDLATLYAALTPSELAELTAAAERSGLLQQVAGSVAVYTDLPRAALQRRLLASGAPRPGYAFRDAPEDVCRALLDALERGAIAADPALKALAWSRHPLALAAFQRWQTLTPPTAWAASLFVAPAVYTREAGYDIVDGNVCQLFAHRCVPISPVATDSSPDLHLFERATGSPCPACGSAPLALVSAPPGADVADVVTCLACLLDGASVFAYTPFATRGWWPVPRGTPASEAPALPEPRGAVLAPPRSPFAALDSGAHGAGNLSQIGGHPAWINDAAYPDCPACRRPMPHLLQIDGSVFGWGEGMFYAFRCSACALIATQFDQT